MIFPSPRPGNPNPSNSARAVTTRINMCPPGPELFGGQNNLNAWGLHFDLDKLAVIYIPA